VVMVMVSVSVGGGTHEYGDWEVIGRWLVEVKKRYLDLC
jgi:hypothetical protein